MGVTACAASPRITTPGACSWEQRIRLPVVKGGRSGHGGGYRCRGGCGCVCRCRSEVGAWGMGADVPQGGAWVSDCEVYIAATQADIS